MADDDEKAGHGGTAKDAERNGTIWVILVGLAVIFIVGSAVASALKPKKKPPPQSTINLGTRAVIVPTDDAARTVVVTPCGTGAKTATAEATALNVAGRIGIRLPQGDGTRTVLVPRCAGGKGAQSGTSNLPSAAFVPEPGTPVPVLQAGSSSSSSSSSASSSSSLSETTDPNSSSSVMGPTAGDPGIADAQVSVPDRSPIRTVVVAPCAELQPKGPRQAILAPKGKSTTAVAPAC